MRNNGTAMAVLAAPLPAALCMVITGLPRYINERKLGIVIRHEKILLCLTVDDQQVGSTLSVKHMKRSRVA